MPLVIACAWFFDAPCSGRLEYTVSVRPPVPLSAPALPPSSPPQPATATAASIAAAQAAVNPFIAPPRGRRRGSAGGRRSGIQQTCWGGDVALLKRPR